MRVEHVARLTRNRLVGAHGQRAWRAVSHLVAYVDAHCVLSEGRELRDDDGAVRHQQPIARHHNACRYQFVEHADEPPVQRIGDDCDIDTGIRRIFPCTCRRFRFLIHNIHAHIVIVI
jgi:hypothetical protein